mmetsp:Transcript_22777/g.73785  ORF Transcript_22777/g.73785 Transcript_22777/m.73785 type:complete len:207 (+) Transcript_22777:231-851(+)
MPRARIRSSIGTEAAVWARKRDEARQAQSGAPTARRAAVKSSILLAVNRLVPARAAVKAPVPPRAAVNRRALHSARARTATFRPGVATCRRHCRRGLPRPSQATRCRWRQCRSGEPRLREEWSWRWSSRWRLRRRTLLPRALPERRRVFRRPLPPTLPPRVPAPSTGWLAHPDSEPGARVRRAASGASQHRRRTASPPGLGGGRRR